jgi:hypothetical protein
MSEDYASPKVSFVHPAYRPSEGNIFQMPYLLLEEFETRLLGEDRGQLYRENGQIVFLFTHLIFLHLANSSQRRDCATETILQVPLPQLARLQYGKLQIQGIHELPKFH